MPAANSIEDVTFEVFDLLYKAWVEDVDEPTRMVGLQGNSIIVFVKGGEHFGVQIVPVQLG